VRKQAGPGRSLSRPSALQGRDVAWASVDELASINTVAAAPSSAIFAIDAIVIA
jgi:hypothetical protein